MLGLTAPGRQKTDRHGDRDEHRQLHEIVCIESQAVFAQKLGIVRCRDGEKCRQQ